MQIVIIEIARVVTVWAFSQHIPKWHEAAGLLYAAGGLCCWLCCSWCVGGG